MREGISGLLGKRGRLAKLRNSRLFRRITRGRSILLDGNRTTLYPHGGDFFPALLAAIDAARHQVLVEYYIVRDDALGGRFASALTAAAARGVRVYLIYDYLGSFDTPSGYFQRLEQGGVHLLCFNPPRWVRGIGWLDKRNHRKTAILDGAVAFVGGLNIGDEYSGFGESDERWRDCGMQLSGPAVEALRQLFWETWRGEGKAIPEPHAYHPPALQEPAGSDQIIVVSGGPHHRRSHIKHAYRLAIAGAQDSLLVVTPYFLPGPRLVRSLLKAVKRGVHVTLILPGQSDVPILKIVGHAYLGFLLKAGVGVYERLGTVLHAKLMLVDGNYVLIGSANFDQRSFHRNFETNLVIESREFGGAVQRMLQDDLMKSRAVSLDGHLLRKWYEPFLELMFAPIKRFL